MKVEDFKEIQRGEELLMAILSNSTVIESEMQCVACRKYTKLF